jgi:D-serine deaminase-like pyridoxal phosphate-dependent protein
MNLVASDVIGLTADRIDTPAVLIDCDVLERNIRRLADYLAQHSLASRPHIKSHKIPEIARAQMDAGSVGITCQKLGEAEVMADAGLTDILIPMNIVGEQKTGRLVALMRRARIALTTDSLVVAQSLSAAACEAAFIMPVLVECDTGQGRCGVQSPAEATDRRRAPGTLPDAPLLTYQLASPQTVVCRCEGVHLKTITAALAAGGCSLGAVKKRTRAGMGRCQGRYCSPVIASFLPAPGEMHIPGALLAPRPPIKPVPIAEIAETFEP